MLDVLLCVVVIFGGFTLLDTVCYACEKIEERIRLKLQWSISHLNYKPKRYGARDYCKPMGF